jgi:hypothetical protein
MKPLFPAFRFTHDPPTINRNRPMVSRLIFHMPATSAAVFEAFHNRDTRLQWDTLLKQLSLQMGDLFAALVG